MRTWAHWTAKTVMLTATFAAAGAGLRIRPSRYPAVPEAAGLGPDGYRDRRARRTYVTSVSFRAVGSSYRTDPSSLLTAVIPSLRQL